MSQFRNLALEVDGLTCSFGGNRAVDRVSFQVAAGEVVGLIGANGAGKTTVLDLVSGFLDPAEGAIRLGGRDITTLRPDRRARLGLGRSFQDARLVGGLTVAECLALAHERHHEVPDHVAALPRLPAMLDAEERVTQSVDRLASLMGLDRHRDRPVRELSTGTRRIVDLAMALAHRPSVLLLDEPSAGIAQRETEALAPLLLRVREATGCALVIVEHDMPLVTAVSDRIVAMEVGRVLTSGPPADVLADPQVVASYLGTNPSAINRSDALA